MRTRIRVGLLLALVTAAPLSSCTGKYVRPTTDKPVEVTGDRLARGAYLVKHVAACGACHDGRANGSLEEAQLEDEHLAGGVVIVDNGMSIYVPNITSDAETGLGTWTDDEIVRAIRDGVRPDGRFLFPMMPFGAYQHMSDEDVYAIVAYLRSVPKVKQLRKGESELSFMAELMLGTFGVAMHEPVVSVPEPDKTDALAYGAYVAQLGHCAECHSMGSMGPRDPDDRFMAGSDGPFEMPGIGKIWSPNLTSDPETGLGKLSAEQLEQNLRAGLRKDGSRLAPPMHLFVPHLALMEDAEMKPLVAYLRSLPPVENQVPARALSEKWAVLAGPPAKQAPATDVTVQATAREVDASGEAIARGQQLFAAQVCSTCHSTDGSPRVGPSLRGIFGTTVQLHDDRVVDIDEAYLRGSILQPGAQLVKGYAPTMPPYAGRLSEEELTSLVAYVCSL